MRKFVISAILAVMLITSLSLSACVPVKAITGSKNLVTEEYDFSDFTRVEVVSAFQVEITQSTAYSVSITADDNLFDFVQVSKAGKTLKIRLKSGYNYQLVTTRAKITMPELDGFVLSGAARGSVVGFNVSGDFEISLSGASSLNMSDMSANDIKIGLSGASRTSGDIITSGDAQFGLSGASRLELIGSANNVLIRASGASSLEMADFTIHDADVGLSGTSDATVNLDGVLDADLSGASNLRYIGEPTIGNLSISGGSELENIPSPSGSSG